MDVINEMNKTVERIVQTVSSREVAEMMEVQHKDLLKKIDKINETLNSEKIRPSKYWIESTYKQAGNGKENREYQITKLGCEFLAHKSTGEKGIVFTARYMDRFEEMEKTLKEQNTPSYMIENPVERAKRWILEYQEKEKLVIENKEQTKVIEKQSDVINELKPHAEYAERVLEDNDGLLNPTQIAKDFGMSGQGLNALLHDLGVQYKQNGQWLLYAKYQGKGYARSVQPDKPYAKSTTKWTQTGKKFIHDILRKNGYKTVFESQQEQERFDFN